MEFLLLWAACAFGCFYIAGREGRSPVGWAIAGALFGIFALIACAVMPRKR